MSKRYQVGECYGYAAGIANEKAAADVYVMDSWYCYRVVWNSRRTPTLLWANELAATAVRWPDDMKRAFAHKLCEVLESGAEWPLPMKRRKRNGRYLSVVERLEEFVR